MNHLLVLASAVIRSFFEAQASALLDAMDEFLNLEWAPEPEDGPSWKPSVELLVGSPTSPSSCEEVSQKKHIHHYQQITQICLVIFRRGGVYHLLDMAAQWYTPSSNTNLCDFLVVVYIFIVPRRMRSRRRSRTPRRSLLHGCCSRHPSRLLHSQRRRRRLLRSLRSLDMKLNTRREPIIIIVIDSEKYVDTMVFSIIRGQNALQHR